MRQLYEIHEVDDYGRSIGTYGTVFAESKDEAEKLASAYHGKPDIYKTGFYEAQVVEQVATITPENIEEHRLERLRQAEYDIKRFSNPLKL